MFQFRITMPALIGAFVPLFGLMPSVNVLIANHHLNAAWMLIPILIMLLGLAGMITVSFKEYIVSLSDKTVQIGTKEYPKEQITQIKVKNKNITFYFNQFPKSTYVTIAKNEDKEQVFNKLHQWASVASIPFEVV